LHYEEKGFLPLTEAVVTRRILLPSEADLLPLFGRNDENLRALESLLALRIVARGNEIILKGDEPRVARAERLLTQLSDLVHSGTPLYATDVRAALRMLADDETADLKGILLDTISVPSRKKQISPKTPNQKRYVDAIRTYDVVVAIGPAGTGKS